MQRGQSHGAGRFDTLRPQSSGLYLLLDCFCPDIAASGVAV